MAGQSPTDPPVGETAVRPTRKRKLVVDAVRPEAAEARRLATRIWELAEPPFLEVESAALLADSLASRGFRVEFSTPTVSTGFRATWGKGRPVIGILGEYDALPDCGAETGTYGQACGHNLLGVGSAVGAVAAARLLEQTGKPGRVVFWGCPAEETLAGKVFMARDGAFRGMDACLCWHPGGKTVVNAAGGSALDSLMFEFFGQTAHGASAHGGRSALDAAVLMDVAVNYLREHVPDNVRIHSVIREGGMAPNVVPEHARIWYYTRAKDRAEVDDITRRVTLCAKGAATATETRMRVRKLTSVYSRLRNRALAELVRDNMVMMGGPRVTKDDRKRAKALGKDEGFVTGVERAIGEVPGRATSDEDSVSWLAPLCGFSVASVSKGVRGHHREYTAQSNLPFAHRAMLKAAEVHAATVLDLASKPALLKRVKDEFRQGTKGFTYDPLVGKRQKPPVEGP